jgi:hypothetical protein
MDWQGLHVRRQYGRLQVGRQNVMAALLLYIMKGGRKMAASMQEWQAPKKWNEGDRIQLPQFK